MLVKRLADHMRQDVIAQYKSPSANNKKGSYKPRHSPLRDEDIIDHLIGKQPIGLYVLPKDLGTEGKTLIAIVDIDDKEKELSWHSLCAEAYRISQELYKNGLLAWPCRSGSGHGVHLWMLWQQAQNARDVREILNQAVAAAKITRKVDIFPAQDSIENGGFGNLVALPFARNSRPITDLLQGIVEEKLEDWLYIDPAYSAPIAPQARAHQKQDSHTHYGGVDTDILADALSYIPTDDYDIWRDVGMALKLAAKLGQLNEQLAEKLWTDWACKDPKFDQRDQDCQWRKFRPNGSLTLGTVWHLAKENGWDGKPVIFMLYDHLDMARNVVDMVGKENILSTIAHVWIWREKGVWTVIPDRELKQLVQRAIERKVKKVTRGLIDSVTDLLKSDVYSVVRELAQDNNTVNFLNGELHWKDGVWELRAHSREHFRTTQIPHIYDAKAECLRFEQFLEEIFQDDPDKRDKISLIKELLGYTLMSHARFEKFALLIGPGANGKSVLLDLIRKMVGSDNVAAVQPSQFSQKFQRAHLHLKLANLVTEVAEGAEISDAELKAIVSGELTTAEHKFQAPFNFVPFCTCWFGTNHLPHTRDFSDALFRRTAVITFNRIFRYGVDADPLLKDKLAAEMPGIINAALNAFGEVLKRGTFTEPESTIKAKQEWRIEADQVAQFVGESCIVELGCATPSKTLYVAYSQWATEAGVVRKLGRKNFTNRVLRLGTQTTRGTGGVRMISGIRLAHAGNQDHPIDF